MGFLQDAISVFKKRELSFIKSEQESDDVYSFYFDKDQDLSWKPGQYGLFSLTHKTIKNGTKPFSIASAPAENVVKITTRIGDAPSEFKKAMQELSPGMKMKMSGPVGSFCLTDNRPSLLIAGGIGITPIRSIVKQIEAEGRGAGENLQLLYLDSRKAYLFKDELDGIASRLSIRVSYLDSKEDLHRKIDMFTSQYKDGNCFVAGPKPMVDSVSGYLQKNNVPKRNIKKDAFFGYS